MPLPLGRVGITLELRPTFVVVLLLSADPRALSLDELGRVLIWLLVVTGSVLVHDLVGAVVLRLSRPAVRVALGGLGGEVTAADEQPIGPLRQLGIAAAGIASSAALVLVVEATAPLFSAASGSALARTASAVLWFNFAWVGLNLVPAAPLDAGAVVRSAARRIAPRRGPAIAGAIALLSSAFAASFAFLSGWLFVGLFLVLVGSAAGRELVEIRRERHDEPLWDQLGEAWGLLDAGQVESATEATEAVVGGARSAALRAAAAEQLAWCWLVRGEPRRAQEQLGRAPAGYRPGLLLRGALTLELGGVREALELLERAHRAEPSDVSASYLERARARAGTGAGPQV